MKLTELGFFCWVLSAGALLAPYALQTFFRFLSRSTKRAPMKSSEPLDGLISVLLPMHNEERFAKECLEGLQRFRDRGFNLEILVFLDGCTDSTKKVLQKSRVHHTILGGGARRGKTHALNSLVKHAKGRFCLFSDASSKLPRNFFDDCLEAFEDPRIGAVLPSYRAHDENEAESNYWGWMGRWMAGANRLGVPLGAHGAAWIARADALFELPADTINDDFVLPYLTTRGGFRQRYLHRVIVKERERSGGHQQAVRLRRIAQGNWQMLKLLTRHTLLRPRALVSLWILKGLKTMGPIFLIANFFASILLVSSAPVLAFISFGPLFLLPLSWITSSGKLFRVSKTLSYGLRGQWGMLLGTFDFFLGRRRKPTHRQSEMASWALPPSSVRIFKRTVDVVSGSLGLVLCSPLLFLCAAAIRIETRGAAFFRQRRLGVDADGRPRVFTLFKLRSMRTDAEERSGPVWAQENDPRVTRVGAFLRKNRLDELPQLINVLVGDMSLIGPRPERPFFVDKINQEVPGYPVRLQGLKPGVTGWAQVHCAYDTSIDSVRTKLLFDLSYVANLAQFSTFVRMELLIILKTVQVMVSGKGAR